MEKSLKKRIAIGVGSLAVGGILAFGAVPAMVRTNNRTETVVRVTGTIGVGEKITASKVKLEQVYAKDQPVGAETSLSAVVGKTAKVEMYVKDTVTSSKISESVQVVPDGKEEISVSVKNIAAGFTGQLQAGDIVSIYGVSSSGNAGTASSLKALKYVKVLNYYSGSASSTSSANNANATLTLLVTDKQSLALTAWDNSTLHFTLVSRGDVVKAAELLKKQDDILQTIPASTLATTAVGQQASSSATSSAK